MIMSQETAAADTALRYATTNGVAHLEFTQPERGNPIDGAFCAAFAAAANDLSTDPEVRAVLITAQGKAFSYGGDLAMFVSSLDTLPQEIKRWTTDLHSGIARLQRMDAPLVVAVHGVCAGGMAAIVAGADLLVASDAARFVAAFTGIGYSSDSGSTVMLSRRMGLARARRFLLLNETLNASQALDAGLADEVVSAEAVIDRARDLAKQFAAGPTRAYGEIRRLLLTASDQPLETQLELEAQALSRMAGSEDAREGLTAFHEKRRPVFVGR
jgi:2-(1,2-epoxy-1,2-dihydrophenyl)acetyl-CoA isomerase